MGYSHASLFRKKQIEMESNAPVADDRMNYTNQTTNMISSCILFVCTANVPNRRKRVDSTAHFTSNIESEGRSLNCFCEISKEASYSGSMWLIWNPIEYGFAGDTAWGLIQFNFDRYPHISVENIDFVLCTLAKIAYHRDEWR